MNERMCGVACPCEETDAKPWTSMSEGDLNAFNRTKEPQSSPTAEKDANGNFYLVTKPDGSPNTVKSYEECLEQLKSINDQVVANGG
jgi:hypothetical protein